MEFGTFLLCVFFFLLFRFCPGLFRSLVIALSAESIAAAVRTDYYERAAPRTTKRTPLHSIFALADLFCACAYVRARVCV